MLISLKNKRLSFDIIFCIFYKWRESVIARKVGFGLIALLDYVAFAMKKIFPCQHNFHLACMTRWLTENDARLQAIYLSVCLKMYIVVEVEA